MTRFRVVCSAFLVVCVVWVSVAEAQPRARAIPSDRAASSIRERMGSRMNGEGNPGAAADDVGNITGDERFLREARDATDFVGADSSERGFVGGQSVNEDGEIRSAIEGELVREAVDPAINRIRSLPQLQTGMYAPRLRLGFTPAIVPAPAIETMALEHLSLSSALRTTAPLEVSMAGRTATLRGAVGSEHEKRLAGLMLLFEPGISKVENQLAVAPPDLATPQTERPSVQD